LVKPQTVYQLVQIPPPAAPTPAPPPAQPSDLTVLLDAARGQLTLYWKGANPAGTSETSYIVRRRLPGWSEFSFIGVSRKKMFVDDTLVAGRKCPLDHSDFCALGAELCGSDGSVTVVSRTGLLCASRASNTADASSITTNHLRL
jgi:hypothetical protein